MAKQTTKKEKFNKILNMARRHGEVVAVFKDLSCRNYLRKRKITKDGKCFVSYLSCMTNRWSRYQTSCFVCEVRNKTLTETIKLMSTHDRGMLMPVELIVKGKVVKL